MNIIASVLHLGNVQYGEGESNACITSDTQIKYLSRVRECRKENTHKKNCMQGPRCCREAASFFYTCVFSPVRLSCRLNLSHFFQLLGVNGSVLMEALTHKKIIAKGEEVRVCTHTLLLKCLNTHLFCVCVTSGLVCCNYILFTRRWLTVIV